MRYRAHDPIRNRSLHGNFSLGSRKVFEAPTPERTNVVPLRSSLLDLISNVDIRNVGASSTKTGN